jgi:hypothetical protein
MNDFVGNLNNNNNNQNIVKNNNSKFSSFIYLLN